ncbi:hypothetical protein GCM10023320_38130 [Pseudonocardia adelaidensis]|uniref:Uncharacterized protein n=2 Tax=Pseudonocardia adelaidensis TaxID=648754 RepID=A0ABP9NP09_9PSEU
MILDSPGASPSVIAHAHGFSAVEVTELLPIFLDNLRADFSSGGGPALVPPAPQPGETPEEHADRYLRELAQNEHLDVVGYDTLGAVGGGPDDGVDLDGVLDQDPAFLDAPPDAPPPTDGPGLDDVATDQPDQHLDDLGVDDPFAAPAPAEIDLPGPADSFDDGIPDDGIPDDGADDAGEPFDMS